MGFYNSCLFALHSLDRVCESNPLVSEIELRVVLSHEHVSQDPPVASPDAQVQAQEP